jgi:integrase
VPRTQVEQILAAIPRGRARDRLLFRLLAETGLRVGETLGLTSTTSTSPSTTNTPA